MNRIFSNITLSIFAVLGIAINMSFMTACSPATETKNTENKPAASGGQNTTNTFANTEKKPEANQAKKDDGVPTFEKEEDYKTGVREKLLKAGWSPSRSEEGEENCVAGGKVCEEFPELEAGPSSPQGAAIFRWKKGDKILLVHALDDPLFYSRHEFEKTKKTAGAKTLQGPEGKYVHTSKHEYGTDVVFYEIKPGNVAVYESEREGADSANLKGTWSWNETDKVLTVKFGDDVYEFKLEGKNLRMIKEPNPEQGTGWKGTIFKKQ